MKFVLVQLERIQYIQRVDGSSAGRSARNYDTNRVNNNQQGQISRNRQQPKLLEIFYCGDRPRSEYLYKSVLIQLRKSGKNMFLQSVIWTLVFRWGVRQMDQCTVWSYTWIKEFERSGKTKSVGNERISRKHYVDSLCLDGFCANMKSWEVHEAV